MNSNKKIIDSFTFVYSDKARNSAASLFMNQKPGIPTNSFLLFIKKFWKQKLGFFGFILLTAIILLAFIMPLIYTDYSSVNYEEKHAAFSSKHIFGTDEYGRDIWARLWRGLRFSIILAFVATLIDLTVGVILGIWMGYSETADKVIMFIIKIITNIPTIILLILLVIVIGASFWVVIFALTVTGWTGMAIQMRGQVLRLTSKDWVTSAVTLGVPEKNIIMSFIPVIIPMIITQLIFTIPGVILAEASLGFIGLSLPNEPTLGNLIAVAQKTFTIYPAQLVVPSMFLLGIIVSIQLIGNSVQDIMKGER